MNWFTKMFSSSIGQKFTMALTGLFLCAFMVVHMIGNLQLFKSDHGLAFNSYAVFMTTFPLIKVVSYLLYASIVYHAVKGLLLVAKNNKARPVKYMVQNGGANSHWTSRNMGILGTIILLFVVVHMRNFWYEYKFGHEVGYTSYFTNIATGELGVKDMDTSYTQTDKIVETLQSSPDGNLYKIVVVKNLYKEVEVEFKELWLVIIYVFAMFALAFHLYHGFQSAFQSLGLNHGKFNGIVKALGIWFFAIIIPASFAAMPLFFYFK